MRFNDSWEVINEIISKCSWYYYTVFDRDINFCRCCERPEPFIGISTISLMGLCFQIMLIDLYKLARDTSRSGNENPFTISIRKKKKKLGSTVTVVFLGWIQFRLTSLTLSQMTNSMDDFDLWVQLVGPMAHLSTLLGALTLTSIYIIM